MSEEVKPPAVKVSPNLVSALFKVMVKFLTSKGAMSLAKLSPMAIPRTVSMETYTRC